MIHDFQEHFSICRDAAPVTAGIVTPGPSRFLACFIFAASSSSQSQGPETEQTNSTSGASSPSIGLTGSNGASVNTGTTVNLSGNSQLQNFDPQVADSAFAAIVQTVQAALGSVTQAVQSTVSQNQQADQSQNALVSSVLAQDQATAANTASGGQTNNNQTVVTIIIAAIAGVLIWAIWGRK